MTRFIAALGILVCFALIAAAPARAADAPVRVGSKSFTESVILGEIMAALVRADADDVAGGVDVQHRRQLGGTRVLWSALLGGDIDAYPEYTGTLRQELLAGENVATLEALRTALGARGIGMAGPVGFNNTYAIGIKPELAARLKLKTISDLVRHPSLRFGFGNEFMDRADGWPALRARYRLPQANVRGMDHDLGYRALASGDIDAIDVYTTDAEIAYYGLTLLADDKRHFPEYDAVILYRQALPPAVQNSFRRLAGAISAGEMTRLNAAVKLEKQTETATAARFVQSHFGITGTGDADASMAGRLGSNTIDHLVLVGISLGAAILIAIPLGILAARRQRTGQVVLAVVGILQTIPSLALLVFMIPLLGIGGPPAMLALFLYSLLPIVRNTHTGLVSIAAPIRDSATALGLAPMAILWRIDLPLAARSILAGIKTSAVINIGTATLGALIGAGGYGQPILTGIRLDDTQLILEGAIPAAVMALFAHALFDFIERLVLPRGLIQIK